MRSILLVLFLTLKVSFLAGVSSHAITDEEIASRVAKMEEDISNIKTAQDGLGLLKTLPSVTPYYGTLTRLREAIYDKSLPLVEDITTGMDILTDAMQHSYIEEYIVERLRPIAKLPVRNIREGIDFLSGVKQYLTGKEVRSVKDQTQALLDENPESFTLRDEMDFFAAASPYLSQEEFQRRVERIKSKIQSADDGVTVLAAWYLDLSPARRKEVLDATLSYITSKRELETLIETLIERGAVSMAEVSYAREKFSNRLAEQQGQSLGGQEPVEQEGNVLNQDDQKPAEQENRGVLRQLLCFIKGFKG